MRKLHLTIAFVALAMTAGVASAGDEYQVVSGDSLYRIAKKYDCTGCVFITDRDGKPDRVANLQNGVARATELFPGFPMAFGVAWESVEAWALGVPSAIAEVLGEEEKRIQQQCPSGVHVEAMHENSGKEDHRPKRLLERIARSKGWPDSVEFRVAIAEKTDVSALEKACPQGFAPFARSLRSAFIP